MVSPLIASAPGSLMLLGEHAVLYGHRAVVLAVEARLSVALTPRSDRAVELRSALGAHRAELSALEPHPAFAFVLECIRRHAPALDRGFALRIESAFSHTIGFGSSAAVTAATLAALHAYRGLPFDRERVLDEAIAVVRAVQGRGSGADVAASVYGGVIGYRAEPREVRPFRAPRQFCAVYSGYKTPTPEVIRRVESLWAGREAELRALYQRIDETAGAGWAALEAGDESALGAALNRGQALMEELGVNTPELASILAALRSDPGVRGAKISGSGLGDCAIALGYPANPMPSLDLIPVRADPCGLLYKD